MAGAEIRLFPGEDGTDSEPSLGDLVGAFETAVQGVYLGPSLPCPSCSLWITACWLL